MKPKNYHNSNNCLLTKANIQAANADDRGGLKLVKRKGMEDEGEGGKCCWQCNLHGLKFLGPTTCCRQAVVLSTHPSAD